MKNFRAPSATKLKQVARMPGLTQLGEAAVEEQRWRNSGGGAVVGEQWGRSSDGGAMVREQWWESSGSDPIRTERSPENFPETCFDMPESSPESSPESMPENSPESFPETCFDIYANCSENVRCQRHRDFGLGNFPGKFYKFPGGFSGRVL